ncbi:GNAT family N-acetyltransferase [Priestia aryabhattai]|uniref:Ribosomal-protein-alanine acetyltransferase n=1 Tax=Priestia megaterium Q3 TaxID=1452722 RepID=A0A806TFE2_PRIMG|nr:MULTISPECIES: GNAT family N-acetyltransferase [Priestia]MCL9634275.1 GNAT family N-acetyltransferase [Bacillus zanthoxyli]AKP76820.1 ribosomal-protein-alanine acetyltransferase [Priestia megaterium Q3]MDT0149269.1 GNAT family N-acetyltransferase [Priestia aryabhattai]MDT0155081.1 GNAT family N-acetyltransferase [Priestia aryabhattai]MED3919077.1 GNAT family N-acetyltransferase [Priestia aryabhattai]
MKEITSTMVNPTIKKLLSYATLEEKVDGEYKKYTCLPSRKLYSIEVNGDTVSCIGVKFLNAKEAVIKHIAVLPKERGKGIGSSIIRFLCKNYDIHSIFAETDKEAVNFYSKFGFQITSLGEKYPGVERFLCEFKVK